MDHHRQFRFNHKSTKVASLGLRTPRQARFPLSATPSVRLACDMGVPTKDLRSDSKPAVASGLSGVPCQPTEKRLTDQVKQLQFWLKVFSRFCQDETEQD
jgi:hypothetical protein